MSNYKKIGRNSKVIEKYGNILKDCASKSGHYFNIIKNADCRNSAINGKNIGDIIDNTHPNDPEHKLIVITLKDAQNIAELFKPLYELVEDDTEKKE